MIFKLEGNQDSHKISDEFEFRQDQTLHFGVTCPCQFFHHKVITSQSHCLYDQGFIH